MSLREDWKKAHKFISSRALLLQVAILTTWGMIPDSMRSYIPNWVLSTAAIACALLVFYGVMTKQANLGDK